MDIQDWQNFGGGGGSSEERLMEAAVGQTLRFSNFLLTFSTNVKPADDNETTALVEWLVEVTDRMFNHWDVLNGTVLKPPGTVNEDEVPFPDDHLIKTVRSRIAIEKGDVLRGKGQVHAHILLEVAHAYIRQEHGAVGLGNDTNRPHLGVHINVFAIRNWLNNRIPSMLISPDRRPSKVYVNSKLLTKGTDLSNKWLTLQYLEKQTARDGNGGIMNLRAAEQQANDAALSHTRQVIIHGGLAADQHTVELEGELSIEDNTYDWREDEDAIAHAGHLSPNMPDEDEMGPEPEPPIPPRFIGRLPQVNPVPPRFIGQLPAGRAAAQAAPAAPPAAPRIVPVTSMGNIPGARRYRTTRRAPQKFK